MSQDSKDRGRPRKVLSKGQILEAMKHTLSNTAGARYLRVSYPHYKKYAKLYKDEKTGKSLFELHKNKAGKGIPKIFTDGANASFKNLEKILSGEKQAYSWSPNLLKKRIIQGGYIEEVCSSCKFSERRVVDSKVPLILNFKDGDKRNWTKENLEFLCYNCYFLYVEDIFTKKQIDAMENYSKEGEKEDVSWELSDEMLEHFESLGLTEEPSSDGTEFIDYM